MPEKTIDEIIHILMNSLYLEESRMGEEWIASISPLETGNGILVKTHKNSSFKILIMNSME